MTVSWVPSSWDAVKTGDTVRLEHGDGTELFGTAHMIKKARGQRLGVSTSAGWKQTIQWAWLGWSVFVPAPTTPPLPTEPGTVIMWENGAYLPHIAQLDPKGRLGWHSDNGDNTERWFTPDALAGYIDGAPFVKLEPAATTAKQIIDRIDAMRAGGEVTTLGQVQALLAAEFGVS